MAYAGYEIQLLADCCNMGPITAATRAFAALSYGNDRPTIIFSSEEFLETIKRCLKPESVVPIERDGYAAGINWNGALWTHHHHEMRNYVFMLTQGKGSDPRLNGCYRILEG
jgi:hypothetical protein